MNSELAEKRKEQILGAAFRIFAEKGYHATAIADIAAELGIGHGTFYRYFNNKLDIFTNVVDRVIADIGKVIIVEAPEVTNTLKEYRSQIRRIGQRLFDLFTKDTSMSKLLFDEAPGIDPVITERINKSYDIFAEFTERYFKNGVEKGFLKNDYDTRTAAYAVNAMIFEGVRRVLGSDDVVADRESWIETVIMLMLDGMAKKETQE